MGPVNVRPPLYLLALFMCVCQNRLVPPSGLHLLLSRLQEMRDFAFSVFTGDAFMTAIFFAGCFPEVKVFVMSRWLLYEMWF